MNNKGFAISGILYSILIIFVVSIAIMLFNLQNRKTVLDEIKVDAVEAVNFDSSIDYLTERINALEEAITQGGADGTTVRYNEETDMVQIYSNNEWVDWEGVGLQNYNIIDKYADGNWSQSGCTAQYSINNSYFDMGGIHSCQVWNTAPYNLFNQTRKYLKIKGTAYITANGGSFPSSRYTYCILELSKDGSNWVTIKTYTATGNSGATSGSVSIDDYINIESIDGFTDFKYIRFNINEGSSNIGNYVRTKIESLAVTTTVS